MAIKIGIIAATYNSAQTLQRSIDSVRNHTYRNFEHIIIGGASKGNAVEILKRNEDVITLTQYGNGKYWFKPTKFFESFIMGLIPFYLQCIEVFRKNKFDSFPRLLPMLR
ncbi:glycosyltransferase [Mucilaginibacter sp.]|uniref:glycosyltransferase n=1 Tax=Mucilaginibacter sp. TaxID=1882438 RepID=UPI002ED3059B